MNIINFETAHLDCTDIEIIVDLSQFANSNHIISIKDNIEYKKKEDGIYYTYHTSHKLYNKECRIAIEFTIVSIFRPYELPPTLVDCQEMTKCHFYHTEALLSEKSKNQGIKCFTDIFLFPQDAKVEARGTAVYEASETYLQNLINQ